MGEAVSDNQGDKNVCNKQVVVPLLVIREAPTFEENERKTDLFHSVRSERMPCYPEAKSVQQYHHEKSTNKPEQPRMPTVRPKYRERGLMKVGHGNISADSQNARTIKLTRCRDSTWFQNRRPPGTWPDDLSWRNGEWTLFPLTARTMRAPRPLHFHQ